MTNPAKLLWVDLETTGLYPERHAIIEISAILTDANLKVHRELTFVVSSHSDSWDPWCVETHTKSGLRALSEGISAVPLGVAAREILTAVRMWSPPKTVALAGRGIHFDRMFLRAHIPELEAHVHRRQLDVASLTMALEHAGVTWHEMPDADKPHRGLDDLRRAIKQYEQIKGLLERHLRGAEIG